MFPWGFRALSFIFIVFFSSSGRAYQAGEIGLKGAIFSSLDVYAKEYRVETGHPTHSLVGISAYRNNVGIGVDVFHAESPIDILVNEYGCEPTETSGVSCERESQYPRCFYFADTGYFSISDFKLALEEEMSRLLSGGESIKSLVAIKMWQGGDHLYGKLSLSKTTKIEEIFIVCQKRAFDIVCSTTSSHNPNEP